MKDKVKEIWMIIMIEKQNTGVILLDFVTFLMLCFFVFIFYLKKYYH